MKVHLKTIGCRLNQSEIDQMAREFARQGHEIVHDPAEADWFVVNTCAVTTDAERSSRRLIRELEQANPAGEITVTGCYAQIRPAEIAVLPGVRRVVGNASKDALVEQVTGMPPAPFDAEPLIRDEARPGASGRTRAFIKVQDGCDNACTFCVTTVARGAGRSRPLAEIITEINALHEAGFQEIVLTGVHLGSYGHDHGDGAGLVTLIKAVLAETAVPRVRLSSLEPWDLSPDFFELWADPRLCPHVHLPLQSGCDATLRRMLRRTTQHDFRLLVESARACVPGISISTDVIVGFPGETEGEFVVSAAFIEAMFFSSLHVFRYSRRPGTAAARMRGHVDEATKKDRSARLHTLADRMQAAYTQGCVGTVRPVLWEQVGGATEDGFINLGYTDNYIRVQAVHPRVLTNQITPARLDAYSEGRMFVEPLIDGG